MKALGREVAVHRVLVGDGKRWVAYVNLLTRVFAVKRSH